MATLGPGWVKLHDVLVTLAESCGGWFAAVVDEGNGLWCVGRAPSSTRDSLTECERAADAFYRVEIAPRAINLRRGEKLDVVRGAAETEDEPRYVAISFASIYVLLVHFERPFQHELARARLRSQVGHVEALTLSLPPRNPEGGEGAAKGRRA